MANKAVGEVWGSEKGFPIDMVDSPEALFSWLGYQDLVNIVAGTVLTVPALLVRRLQFYVTEEA